MRVRHMIHAAVLVGVPIVVGVYAAGHVHSVHRIPPVHPVHPPTQVVVAPSSDTPVSPVTVVTVQTPYGPKAGPSNLYPDPKLTPGAADTYSMSDIQKKWPCPSGAKAGSDGLCTYSAAHRNVSQAEKDQVYQEYEQLYPGLTAYCHEKGYTSGTNQRCEVDHFCPVGGGCSNDITNLWIQRADTTYNGRPMGFHEKDNLEAWGIAQEKAGKLDPKEFDTNVWTDWVAYYLKVNPPSTTFSN